METAVTEKAKNKGGRPPKEIDVEKVLASPQGAAAVAAATDAAVARALPGLIEQLSAQLAARAGASSTSSEGNDLIKSLALGIADMADQGTGRVRVAPEELGKRKKALDAMGALLMDAYAKREEAKVSDDEDQLDAFTPEYELIDKFYVQDRLVEPFHDEDGIATPTVIQYGGAPGPALRPANHIAKLIFEQYCMSIGGEPDTMNGAEKRPMWVMLGKVVVKTSANARFRDGQTRRQVGNLADSNNGTPFDAPRETFSVKRSGDPRANKQSILGTVHPPAQKFVAGQRQ